MNELETQEKPFSLRRRLLWVVGVPAVAFLIVAGAIDLHRESRATNELEAALGRLDETDPGWRLDDIEAARVRLKDQNNSAVLCRELAQMLGPKWPDPKVDDQVRDAPLGELLDARRKVVLEDEMERLRSIRLVARRMVDLPKGRHRIEYKPDILSTLLTDQQDVRKVAILFDYEMRFRANQGEVSEAVRAGRACACAARSLYDEPLLISALIRISVLGIALGGAERSLALGESNDAELAALDSLLADEGRHNTYLCGLRGERAMMYLLYKRMASGEVPVADDLSQGDGMGKLLGGSRRSIRRQTPAMLDAMNRCVAIARLPPHEQAAAEAALGDGLEDRREPYSLLLSSMQKVGAACRRKAAQVAAMRGLIAVERYRMKHKKWPAALAEVVPEFLKEVPADPFDGKPLRLSKVRDGVVVYSVGADGVDDGGKLDRENPAAAGSDLGYQLWDAAKRRRPASPPKPKRGEDEP